MSKFQNNVCKLVLLIPNVVLSHLPKKAQLRAPLSPLQTAWTGFDPNLIVDYCEAFDRVCQNCLWRKLGKLRLNEKMRNTLETIYKHAQEGWRSKWPIVRPDLNKKWSKTRLPIEPFIITFISDILKLLNERRFTGVTLGTSQINSLLFAIRL